MKCSMSAVVLGVLGLSIALPVCAQDAHWGKPGDPTVKMIKASEKMWLDGDCAPQPGLKDVFADDFQGTSPDGKRYGKKQAMATDDPPPATDCRLGEISVHFFGDHLALVYGSESSMRKDAKGKPFKRCLVWTDTWLKRSGRWQIVAAQDNRVHCK